MNKLLQFILKILTKLVLKKYRPIVIGVTGSVGKTSTKDAIYVVLKNKFNVRKSGGNLNNQLGVPLAVLGNFYEEYFEKGGLLFWSKVILRGLSILITKTDYPKMLILELAADRPGDIGYLVSLVRPKIGVVTAIGEIPVHVEFFSGPEHLAKEKAKLISALPSDGFSILNFDDEIVLDMKEESRAKVLTYGFDQLADIKLSNFDFIFNENNIPLGISFKLDYEGSFLPIRLYECLGRSQAYAAAAAAAVGIVLGINLVDIANSLASFKSPPGRLNLIKGIKNSLIIDDTYNASPISMHLALDTLRALPAKRKIAVLGDMLELGKYTISAHRDMGNLAAGFVDLLFCIGPKARFIYDSAYNQMPPERLFSFYTIDEAKSVIQENLQEGDLILIKGSQSMRMEKIVEEIMAEPERKKELLVRQSKKWIDK